MRRKTKPKYPLKSSKNQSEKVVEDVVAVNQQKTASPFGQISFFNALRLSYWLLPTLVILSLALWVLFTRSLSVYGFTLDDSFITYRYAKHLVNGVGLIWNHGESPPVEGYTTFLWVIINAVFEFLRLDPAQSSKLVSFASVLIFLPLFLLSPTFLQALGLTVNEKPNFITAKPTNLTLLAVLLGSVFFASALWVSPDTPAHVVSGMETMFAGLLLLLLAMSFCYFDTLISITAKYGTLWTKALSIVVALLALACGMVRPEFNAAIGLGFISLFLIQHFWLAKKAIAKIVLMAFMLYVALGLTYYLWRYSFYGLPFPLPFYIKQWQSGGALFKGLSSMHLFYVDYWAFLWAATIGAMLCPKRLLPALLMAAITLFYFLLPEHIMGIYSRFPYPVLPLVMWLGVNALHRLMSWLFIPNFLWVLGLPLIIFSLVIGTENLKAKKTYENREGWNNFANNDYRWLAARVWMEDYRDSEYRSLIPFGKAIGLAKKEGQPPLKIAMVDLGAVAYYGDWDMIDLFGLTHPKLALARSRGEYSADLLLKEEPDVVLLGEFYRERKYRGQFPFEQELYQRMSSYNYIPAVRFIWNSKFGFLVFAKNDNVKKRFASILLKSPEIAPSLQILPNVPLSQLPPHFYVTQGK